MRNGWTSVVVSAIGLFVAPVAPAQNLAWKSDGSSIFEQLGQSAAFLGDLDGDLVPDLVAGGPAFPTYVAGQPVYLDQDPLWPLSTFPRVHLISGADGHELRRIDGPAGSALGVSVANAGDVDGDGLDDVLVGAPLDGDGAAYLFSGASGAQRLVVRGTSSGSALGACVAGLGDVDGDGVPDFAAGAPFHDVSGAKTGRVAIFSGANGAQLAEWFGAKDGSRLGMRLVSAGDLDGDAVADLAVVDQDVSSTRDGRVDLVSGATFAALPSIALSSQGFVDRYDWRIAAAGDVDADGAADLVVWRRDLDLGGPMWFGPTPGISVAWVYSGASGALLHTYGSVLGGAAGVGDVNADGHDDFALVLRSRIAPPLTICSGIDGKVLSYVSPQVSGGMSMLVGGQDLDGDGVPDLGMDAAGVAAGGQGGALEAVSLAAGVTLWTAYGEGSGSFGSSIELHDDLDGDGHRELLVGASGYARFVSGRTGATLREVRPQPLQPTTFGVVAALPDVDGDAVMDWAVGDPLADTPTAARSGRVEIRSGATDAVLRSFDGTSSGEQFGAVLAVGVQPATGATQVLVGVPWTTNIDGRVDVFDATSGATVFQLLGGTAEMLGILASWVGDMNGDGVGDWALATGPYAPPPVVRLVSGVDGTTIREFKRHVGTFDWDDSLSSGADFDGDGLADLVLGNPDDSYFTGGTVEIVSSQSGAPLLSFGSSDPTDALFGIDVAVLGDVNGDGFADIAVTGAIGAAPYADFSGVVELHSGKDGALLARFATSDLGSNPYAELVSGLPAWELLGGATGSSRVASGQSVDGDAIPDLAIGAMLDAANGTDAGSVSLRRLDDLLLQATPDAPAVGDTVTIATRGGVASQLAGLWMVAFDSVPMLLLADLGPLDALGQRSLASPLPSYLAGHVLTLQAWSIGFAGRVTDSQAVDVAVQ